MVGVGSGSDGTTSKSFSDVESTGGEYNHKLTTTEIPAHTHGSKSLTGWFNALLWETFKGSGITSAYTSGVQTSNKTASSGRAFGRHDVYVNATHEHTSVGGSGSHNNIQPYVTVYYWKRTA